MCIRIAAFKGITLTSKIIRFWTRSCYSHVAYVFDEGIIEAWKFKGGMRWGYSDWSLHTPGTPVEIWEKEVTPEQKAIVEGVLKAMANAKTKYDWKGILGFVVKCDDWKDKYFCSEGVAYALVKAGIWPKELNIHVIHPGYFVQLALVSGFKKIKEFTVGRC